MWRFFIIFERNTAKSGIIEYMDYNIAMKKLQICKTSAAALLVSLLAVSCQHDKAVPAETLSGLNPENFVSVYQGDSTALFVLKNGKGAEVCITNFGGRVVSLMVPDREGNMRDVVLGFDSVQAYYPENNLTDFGSAIGRYANRINQGRFMIEGDTAVLPQNDFGHCLHGGGEMGSLGWQYRVYNAEQPNDSTLVLTIESEDGDNGFPGKVNAKVTYILRDDYALDIAYEAVTDKPTVVNMTNHSYFNLSGNPEESVEKMWLTVNADGFTPVDSTFMTSGEILLVEKTPFDFRISKEVGRDINDTEYEQIQFGRGYDHNFVLNTGGNIDEAVAELYSPESGILLSVYTTEPGVQVYSGNFLDGTMRGKRGKKLKHRTGLCLETQHYPDSPNKPHWPTTRLNPGETYSSRTIYKFDTK